MKMKAFRLRDLLEVILDGIAPKLNISKEEVEVDVMGLVPGEKLHEDLINNTETNRVYELDGMYVILRNNEDALRYQNIKKIDLHEYTSKDTELISKDAIKDMVIEYLNTKYGFKNG